MKTLACVLAILGLCAACAMGQSAKEPRMISGTPVWVRGRVEATPLVEVTDLRFAEAVRSDNGSPCTVVAGKMISHIHKSETVVTLAFQFYGDPGHNRAELDTAGKATVTIERPVPDVPTPFVAVAEPGVHVTEPQKRIPRYILSVSFGKYSPPAEKAP